MHRAGVTRYPFDYDVELASTSGTVKISEFHAGEFSSTYISNFC
jgi:hypothetical protein